MHSASVHADGPACPLVVGVMVAPSLPCFRWIPRSVATYWLVLATVLSLHMTWRAPDVQQTQTVEPQARNVPGASAHEAAPHGLLEPLFYHRYSALPWNAPPAAVSALPC